MKRIKCITAAALALICVFNFVGCATAGSHYEQSRGEWVVTTASTCETDGIETFFSQDDGAAVQTRALVAHGHNWDVWQIVIEPTCTASGVEKRFCKDCGNFDVRSIEPLGHEWGDWISGSTCSNDGIDMRICNHDDNHVDIRQGTALGHDFGEWIVAIAPTCEAAGEQTRFCRHDNGHTETLSVEPLGHDWSDWVVLSPATETTDGEEIRICRNDKKHTETRVAYATGSPELQYELSDDGAGYKVRTDSSLADTLVEAIVPAYHNRLPITGIAGSLFRFFTKLQNVTFLEGSMIEGIPPGLFHDCHSLLSVKLPSNITYIHNAAFSRCYSLKSIVIPASVTFLGNAAFIYCTSLQSVTFEEGSSLVKMNGQHAFGYCTNLVSIEIPASVEAIGYYTFRDWTAGQTIYVKGYASEAEADAAWHSNWRAYTSATIIYQG